MARKRKGDKVDGWVVLDKPVGLGSTPAVGQVRRLFGAQKAGHGGTLDPLASGVLPIALGEATKTVPFVMDGRKEYRFTLRFGEARSTEDVEGEVTATSEVRPEDEAIRAALAGFVGDDRADAAGLLGPQDRRQARLRPRPRRRGGRPEAAAGHRSSAWSLLGRPDADHADFVVACGKGTYIRSLGRDLALALGTVGHLVGLRRTAVGPFRRRRPFRFPNWRPSGIFPRFSGPWPPSRPRWTTSRRWP